jgi:hypothetical protein
VRRDTSTLVNHESTSSRGPRRSQVQTHGAGEKKVGVCPSYCDMPAHSGLSVSFHPFCILQKLANCISYTPFGFCHGNWEGMERHKGAQ